MLARVDGLLEKELRSADPAVRGGGGTKSSNTLPATGLGGWGLGEGGGGWGAN